MRNERSLRAFATMPVKSRPRLSGEIELAAVVLRNCVIRSVSVPVSIISAIG